MLLNSTDFLGKESIAIISFSLKPSYDPFMTIIFSFRATAPISGWRGNFGHKFWKFYVCVCVCAGMASGSYNISPFFIRPPEVLTAGGG